MRHPKSLSVSYKLLIVNNSILSQQKSDEVGKKSRFFFDYSECSLSSCRRQKVQTRGESKKKGAAE